MSETSQVNIEDTKQINKHVILAGLVVLFSVVLRWGFMSLGKVPFNSDEAIVGIMASHILSGEVPIFFYGQAYMGSLDSYLVAGSFLLFGKTIFAIRISQTFLFVFLCSLVYVYAKLIIRSHRAALATTILVAAAPVNFLLYTTVTLGGYLEALVIGMATLIINYQIELQLEKEKPNSNEMFFAFILGCLIGLGIWVLGITLVFSISAITLLLLRVNKLKIRPSRWIKLILFILAGCLLGIMPVISHLVNISWLTFIQELTGSAIAIQGQSYFAQVGLHIVNLLMFGLSAIFGFRPPWNTTWLLLPFIPLVLFAWYIVIRDVIAKKRLETAFRLWLPSLILVLVFIASPFGADPSGRYFLPIQISLALSVGIWFSTAYQWKTWIRVGILIFLVVYNLGGSVQSISASKYGMSTQFAPGTEIDHAYDEDLISFLTSTNNNYGYSTYWGAYPIIFKSNEEVILVPALPYHTDLRYTTRDDRYRPFSELVKKFGKPYLCDFQ